jgi:type I restriction enzyme S subunit
MYFEYIHSEIIDDRIDAQFFTPEYIKSLKKINQFRIETLGNISRRIFDPPHTAPEFVDKSDFEMIMIENITLNGIEGNFRAISETCHKDIFKNSHLEGNELLVSRVGNSSGTFASVFPCYKGKNVSGNISIIKLKDEIIDKEYAFAYFNSNIGQNSIKRNIANTARKFLTISKIREFQVPIPSPEIQKYIGDKVRKAEELREEAKTLQKEIDILLEVDMLLKEETDKVYNIYDSKINWTNEINIEDRIDPNFYQKKYISTIEKLGNNKVRLEKYVRITKIRYQTGNINKYIEISSINNSFGTIDEVEELRPEEIPTSAKYQVKEGDILVSLVRPTRKAISIVTKEYDNAICTGGFAVLQSKGKVPVEFLTAVLRTNFVGIQFERYCAGSTYPTINEDDVVKVFIPMYSENQINKITENYRRIIDNIYTSKKLIEEAKQDVEDLIEGNFDMSKVKATS